MASLIRVAIVYDYDGNIYPYEDLPLVVYDDDEWFSPYDWEDEKNAEMTIDRIESIVWRLAETNYKAIVLNGLPRIFI
uniref:Uncharacterized protein n=1 Tax=Prevotella sp. GTC17254 TaxID=3236794 RepID=A0AB33J1N1_9BACT